jgi:Protein of unknown function (DUF3631)
VVSALPPAAGALGRSARATCGGIDAQFESEAADHPPPTPSGNSARATDSVGRGRTNGRAADRRVDVLPPGRRQKYGVEPPQLEAMVKAVLAEREKAKREEKVAVERTTKRRERRDAEDAKRQEKEADRAGKAIVIKRKAIATELKAIAKLPTAEWGRRLVIVAGQLDDVDLEELRAELQVLVGKCYEDEIELWPEPVTTKDLLSDVSAQVQKYVVVDDASAMVVGLWTLFSWVHDIAVHSPILLVTSAEKDSGKSTLLGVLSFLVPHPYQTVELTGPGLYRIVDLLHPTLIVDEADKLFARKNDLLHIANSGWARGTRVTRIVSGFPREFDTFCPKAIGMKGLNMPDTLASRGVIIKLWPKRDDERVHDFSYCDNEAFETLRRKAARWARDHGDKVAATQPAMPIGFSNRTGANWKTLFAIAELAGCLKQAHAAAVALVAKRRGQLSEGSSLARRHTRGPRVRRHDHIGRAGEDAGRGRQCRVD